MLFLIWVVQLNIYPSFRKVKPGRFLDWHKRYMRRISWLVGPPMAGQVVAGLGFLFLGISPARVLYMTLVAATLILTGLVAAPLHEKLQDSEGFGANFPIDCLELGQDDYLDRDGVCVRFLG